MLRTLRWVRHKMRDWKESKLNREKVGEDRFGNEYYQYYSAWGLPIKKEINFADWNRAQLFEDVHFFPWLRRQELEPPTQGELKRLYEADRIRKLNAVKYNNISKELDAAYYEKKEKIEKLWNPRPLTADDFEPQKWDPSIKSRRRKTDELPE